MGYNKTLNALQKEKRQTIEESDIHKKRVNELNKTLEETQRKVEEISMQFHNSKIENKKLHYDFKKNEKKLDLTEQKVHDFQSYKLRTEKDLKQSHELQKNLNELIINRENENNCLTSELKKI